jgi:hypothetical protein
MLRRALGSEYREMLHQAAHRLPHGVKVVVLADRGFIHTEAMTAMRIAIKESVGAVIKTKNINSGTMALRE